MIYQDFKKKKKEFQVSKSIFKPIHTKLHAQSHQVTRNLKHYAFIAIHKVI